MEFVIGKDLPRLFSVTDVLITDELRRRDFGESDESTHNAALEALARSITAPRLDLLGMLALQAHTLCNADTSGISMIHHDSHGEEYFGWDVMAGTLAPFAGGTTPRNWSPCGTTVDLGKTQLFLLPGRAFHYFLNVDPQIVEGLVVPIHVNRVPIATLWIASHKPSRKFTLWDVKVAESLASFVGAALSRTEWAESNLRRSEKRVWICEDVFIDQRESVATLNEIGVKNTEVVSNVSMALENLSACERGERPVPDLILLDLHLGMDSGFEVLRRWKSSLPLHKVPVVVWTAITSAVEREICNFFGVASYVLKVDGRKALEEAVISALDTVS